ncbi:MAG: hypothetical protein IT169_06770 [Bryobacterales bacterium]|nr:hypothetical protein [Bryobacterales bacterium]
MRATRITAWIPFFGLLVTMHAFGQSGSAIAERDHLWLSIRDAMRTRIKQLGDYTCIQNITRFEKAQGAEQERPLDTIRMQVTALGGRESYSWPGSANASGHPSDLLRTGLLGTGAFQGFIRALFVSPGPSRLEYLGKESAGGEPLLHFRFAFDLRQQLILNIATGRASVAVKGEFWAREQDHTVRRLRIESAQPAPEINVKSAEYNIEWTPVALRGKSRLLPEAYGMRLEKYSGEIQRNEVTLSQCRAFEAESSVRFDSVPGVESTSPEPTATPVAAGFLPAGLTVALRLLTPIDSNQAAVGDLFEAEVTRDLKHEGKVFIRKGDRAEGRIRVLARYAEPESHTLLWLEISTLHSGGKEWIFLGEVKRAPQLANMISEAQGFTEGRLERIGVMGAYRIDRREYRAYASVPGVASLLFRGNRAFVPAGYEMEWTTLPARSDNGR